MRFPTLLIGGALAAATPVILSPALAAQSSPAPDKPITDRDVKAGDVVTTPVSDLNLKKEAIPPLLLKAQERPYDTASLKRCDQIAAAVGELDAVLGDDVDLPEGSGDKLSAGRVAQAAVGSFIPFRGLIREVSGANEQQRKVQAAVTAGIARRAFLKGYGEARACRYPARSATGAVVARANTLAPPPKSAPKSSSAKPAARKGAPVQYTKQPVVQKVD